MPRLGLGQSVVSGGGKMVPLQAASNVVASSPGGAQADIVWNDPPQVPNYLQINLHNAADNSLLASTTVGIGVGNANFGGLPAPIDVYAIVINIGGGVYISSAGAQSNTTSVTP